MKNEFDRKSDALGLIGVFITSSLCKTSEKGGIQRFYFLLK